MPDSGEPKGILKIMRLWGWIPTLTTYISGCREKRRFPRSITAGVTLFGYYTSRCHPDRRVLNSLAEGVVALRFPWMYHLPFRGFPPFLDVPELYSEGKLTFHSGVAVAFPTSRAVVTYAEVGRDYGSSRVSFWATLKKIFVVEGEKALFLFGRPILAFGRASFYKPLGERSRREFSIVFGGEECLVCIPDFGRICTEGACVERGMLLTVCRERVEVGVLGGLLRKKTVEGEVYILSKKVVLKKGEEKEVESLENPIFKSKGVPAVVIEYDKLYMVDWA